MLRVVQSFTHILIFALFVCMLSNLVECVSIDTLGIAHLIECVGVDILSKCEVLAGLHLSSRATHQQLMGRTCSHTRTRLCLVHVHAHLCSLLEGQQPSLETFMPPEIQGPAQPTAHQRLQVHIPMHMFVRVCICVFMKNAAIFASRQRTSTFKRF